eukprot:TRINITY_DN31782_c0_g1_i1.p1 TRINITY_DN31782_c0_g1~~TRINITY_DN31782_c0_g1_i1.p1  ORF type:complete len:406 (+),score=44.55 TRINITY_DN31782_c0_g1_i1:166-1383(+)
MSEMSFRFFALVFVLFLELDKVSGQCGEAEDFTITRDSTKQFVISQSTGTCYCPGGFVGRAANLTALELNPAIANLTVAVDAQLARTSDVIALASTTLRFNATPGGLGADCYQNSDCTGPNLVCSLSGRVCVGYAGNACNATSQCADFLYCNSTGKCSDPPSCMAIKTLLPNSATGYTYRIDPDGAGPLPAMTVGCDMSLDGGGWTLVAYAGAITTNKYTTTGTCSYMLLFDNFGTYTPNSPVTKTSFSRLGLFYSQLKPQTEVLARRTSVPDKLFIWPVSEPHLYWAPVGSKKLPLVPYLRLSITGGVGLKTVTNSLTVFSTSAFPVYNGYNWNTPVAENCDSCGRSFASALNHRSLLYWETNDAPCTGTASYSDTQWFHGTPLQLGDSVSAQNTVQDIEFWIR